MTLTQPPVTVFRVAVAQSVRESDTETGDVRLGRRRACKQAYNQLNAEQQREADAFLDRRIGAAVLELDIATARANLIIARYIKGDRP